MPHKATPEPACLTAYRRERETAELRAFLRQERRANASRGWERRRWEGRRITRAAAVFVGLVLYIMALGLLALPVWGLVVALRRWRW